MERRLNPSAHAAVRAKVRAMACPLGTNERQNDMCTGEVCYSWHYVPWANIACVMILLANYWIVKHYATKWLENFLAMRKIHKSILAQQRRMYSERV